MWNGFFWTAIEAGQQREMKEYEVLRNYLHQIWSQGIDVASNEIYFLSDFRIDLDEHPLPPRLAEQLRGLDRSWHLKEYGNSSGDPYVREALARLENARLGTELYGPENIMVTLGATGAASMIYKGFLRPGARILMIPPIYYVFAGAAEQLGMQVEFLATKRENDFLPTVDQLDSALRKKGYDLVVITNPTFPVGRAYPSELLYALLDRIEAYNRRRSCLVILDEVYAQLAFDARTVDYGPGLGRYEFLFRTNSMSKSLGTAGLRIGYFCAHPALCKRIHKPTGWPVMDFLNELGDLEYGTPPPVFGPYIVAASDFFTQVLNGSKGADSRFWRRNLGKYLEKLQIVIDLVEQAGLDYIRPDAAFSLMIELRGARSPQDQFRRFKELLRDKKVYALPGCLYRLPENADPAMVRVSFGQPIDRLEEGLRRALDFWLR